MARFQFEWFWSCLSAQYIMSKVEFLWFSESHRHLIFQPFLKKIVNNPILCKQKCLLQTGYNLWTFQDTYYLVTYFITKLLNRNVHFMCSFLSEEVLLPTDFLRYAHMYARATLVKWPSPFVPGICSKPNSSPFKLSASKIGFAKIWPQMTFNIRPQLTLTVLFKWNLTTHFLRFRRNY